LIRALGIRPVRRRILELVFGVDAKADEISASNSGLPAYFKNPALISSSLKAGAARWPRKSNRAVTD
jgi:hypothetical protein